MLPELLTSARITNKDKSCNNSCTNRNRALAATLYRPTADLINYDKGCCRPTIAAFPNKLIYGAGLRVAEYLRLRVQDVEFDRDQINVRKGRGANDRVTVLPPSLVMPLKEHLKARLTVHQADLTVGL